MENTQTINQLKSLILTLSMREDKDFSADIEAINNAIIQLAKIDNARDVLIELLR